MEITGQFARRHWFYLLLPIWIATAFAVAATDPWVRQPDVSEKIALFDWCVFMPALYLVCYRRMPRRALALRTMALACGGMWIAGRLVPDRTVPHYSGWLRPVGALMLLALEGTALLAVLRNVFGREPDPMELEKQGLPPIVARMMLAEARFWRRVWTILRGR